MSDESLITRDLSSEALKTLKVWKDACRPDQTPEMTIKSDSGATASPHMSLVIKEKTLRTLDDTSSEDNESPFFSKYRKGKVGFLCGYKS